MSTTPTKATGYDAANLRTAKEILANPEQHGGVDAFPAVWARAVLERLKSAAPKGDIYAKP